MDYGVLPVILCGGSGSRLWPLSTADRPKPFHPIAGDETLLQATVRRLRPSPAAPFLAPVIVCAAAHEDLVRAQLRAIGVRPAMVLVEAEPGGTALATACAVRAAMEIAPEAKVLIAPADHHISDAQGFRAAVMAAAGGAGDDLVLFSARPESPETGYGYMRRGRALPGGLHLIERFIEKPALETATAMIAEGGWGWNMGLFLGRPAAFQDQIARHAPTVAARAGVAWSGAERRGSRLALAAASGPAISLDRAVIEHSDRLAMTACDVGWRDVGCWSALWSAASRDPADNHLQGSATVVESSGCLVWSGGGAPVAVIGMTDVVVVSTPSGVLVMPRARAQEVGALSTALPVRVFNSAVDELGSASEQGAPHDLHRPPLDLR
ncbi:NTP transferase domain-containing protein [Brevundimonas sp. BAL450]|uniref:mannose-1-phosphate guanylyltransferase n=2 Tax=Brevundimonas TaxID=41275 RepID=UPI0018CAC170|nr:sugar phosphate nucleotidyltransferase [Brevundimonas sp. BAL450]MBG7616184.1 NTP transferase domain-containing protein [Brevundimonas sp. BAL450]